MYRLLSLSALLLLAGAEPRSPRIYNVLISSKKNLSPSHALPVYEPVLRPTLGVALPPIFYQTPLAYQSFVPVEQPQKPPQTPPNDETPPVEQFIPYGYQPQGDIFNFHQEGETAPPTYEQQTEDPKQVIANLKRNPNIPDVPPPALPTRNKS